jgi:hypothetical protein
MKNRSRGYAASLLGLLSVGAVGACTVTTSTWSSEGANQPESSPPVTASPTGPTAGEGSEVVDLDAQGGTDAPPVAAGGAFQPGEPTSAGPVATGVAGPNFTKNAFKCSHGSLRWKTGDVVLGGLSVEQRCAAELRDSPALRSDPPCSGRRCNDALLVLAEEPSDVTDVPGKPYQATTIGSGKKRMHVVLVPRACVWPDRPAGEVRCSIRQNEVEALAKANDSASPRMTSPRLYVSMVFRPANHAPILVGLDGKYLDESTALQRDILAFKEARQKEVACLDQNDLAACETAEAYFGPRAVAKVLGPPAESDCLAGKKERCDLARRYVMYLPNGEQRVAKFYESACQQGDLDACVEVGGQLFQLEGDPTVQARGKAAYAKACDGGKFEGCLAIAASYMDSNPALAKPWWKKACATGDLDACREAGDVAGACKAGDVDSCIRVKDHRGACAGGHAPSCDTLCKAGDKKACEGATEGFKFQRERANARAEARRNWGKLLQECRSIASKMKPLLLEQKAAEKAGDDAKYNELDEKIEALRPDHAEAKANVEDAAYAIAGDSRQKLNSLRSQAREACYAK